MSTKPNRFAVLLERVRQGDEQAANELFEEYHQAVIRFIRFRLQRVPQLRTLFDSTDFVQEMWLEIAAHPDKLREIETFKDFLQFLKRLAEHRIEHARRKHLEAEKRDLRRARHLSDPDIEAAVASIADPRPGPAQRATHYDLWLRWIESLPPRPRAVALFLRAGRTQEEIAAMLRCSQRSVERIVAEIREIAPPGRSS